jgi:hypothetical protein
MKLRLYVVIGTKGELFKSGSSDTFGGFHDALIPFNGMVG